MNNTELIEKLAVIMDRLDRLERKIDELNKKQASTITIPTYPTTVPTYPQPIEITCGEHEFDGNKITCEAMPL